MGIGATLVVRAILLGFFAWTGLPSAGAAYPTPPGCAQVETPSGATFYVDPDHGADSNDGSHAAPLKSLQRALDRRLFPSGSLVYLRSGAYGDISIRQYANTAFVHVKAEAGHWPTLRSLHLQATSHWLFEGLKINRTSYDLVRIYDNASDIVVAGNELYSTTAPQLWSMQDWRDQASTAIVMEGRCGTVVNNTISNVYHGILMAADDGIAEGNRISFFAGDGMHANGNRVTLRRNRITDNIVVDGNHADGIQSFNIDGPGFNDQTLDGNIIIQTTSREKPFDDFLQGIGFFDGPYRRLKIINNVIILPSYHGITVYDVHDSWIINNTVTGGDLPWIQVVEPSSNVIVRNNLANRIDLSRGSIGDHNLLLGRDPGLHFVQYQPSNYLYDLRLKPKSAAIGAGSTAMAPASDVVGTPRSPPIDIGAYQHPAGWRASTAPLGCQHRPCATLKSKERPSK